MLTMPSDDQTPICALLVDDDDVDRERLARLLAKYNRPIDVEQSASKSEALQLLKGSSKQFSFIFLDFKLEDGDGRDLLPDIWEKVGADCVVIAVTGNGSERSAAEAIKLGIHEYLSKRELSEDMVVKAINEGLRWLEDNKRIREMESALLHRSLHDPLTDLYNRHVFFERLEHQCALYRRDGTACAVLVVDLDDFKQVNDRLGHETGDALLVQASLRMRDAIREIDTIARLGGDEFACILPGVRTFRQAITLGKKVSACFDAPFAINGEMVCVGASVGIAACPQHGGDPHILIKRADSAMYRAKSSVERVVLYDELEPSSTNPLDRFVLLSEAEEALKRHEFDWYWQPKIDLSNREVVGFEALARWHHSKHGYILPDLFIKAIENTKLIWPFTLATIDTVLAQLTQLDPQYGRLSTSINISAQLLQYDRFVPELLRRVQTAGLDPQRLTLELTETTLISNHTQARAVLHRLQQNGIRISIDDFGAGFTSFSYLRDFTVTEIKIDKAYVESICERPFDQALVRCIATFCDSQKLSLVAEGVETKDAWEKLFELGCRYGQGFGIARPMPFADVPKWLTAWQVE